jgi:hypothetical protein
MDHWRVEYSRTASRPWAIHTIRPGDIIGEHGQRGVDVPCVKAIVDALEEFDITRRGASLTQSPPSCAWWT